MVFPFDQSLTSNYNEVKHKFRHPWFTYIGIALIAFAIIGVILAAIL